MSEAASAASRLRDLPPVHRIMDALPADLGGQAQVVDAVRDVIREARIAVLSGGPCPDDKILAQRARERVEASSRPALRAAINAAGVILHTGLGRSVLSQAAVQNIAAVAAGHSTLEIDPETGQRGSRLRGVSALLRTLVGCEDAVIVNNNAAAVLLAVRTLAHGKDVVISRGELVEIGGQFRIPDVITSAGARLVEVGTTNKTHLSDYERAVSTETAMILHVHPSNFRMVGFTSSVPLPDLAELARRRGVIFMADLGSGALFNLESRGVPGEPTVQQVHSSGIDLCTWSGDKLLGGPQCGIITGSSHLVSAMKSDPLMRALRVDKLILAALEATLRLYLDPSTVCATVPTLRAITRPVESVREQAQRLKDRLAADGLESGVAVVDAVSQVGGGSLPGDELPSAAVDLAPPGMTADDLARRLRTGPTPVFGRVNRGSVLLDLRTVADHEMELLASAILAAVHGNRSEA